MIINTISAFNYGHTVDINNYIIPLDDGGGEVAVEVDVGAYSLGSFVQKVAQALNTDGNQDYTVSLNRNTRQITISAPSNFDLLFASSTNSEISLRVLLGFDNLDYTGSNVYTAPNPSGSQYVVQFKLQDFVDFKLSKKTNNASVNETGSGRVEVVKYADNFFMSCTITLITDITHSGEGAVISNPTGVQDALDFMNYATRKTDIEFVYDIDNQDTFEECILESTGQSREGVDFDLTPLYSRGLTGYYELRRLVFRQI